MNTLSPPPFARTGPVEPGDARHNCPTRPSAELAELRVLVSVANDGRPHAVCARCFSPHGHPGDIHWLEDTEEARESLAAGAIDIAVLDGQHNGLELLHGIAEHGLHVPVILFLDDAGAEPRPDPRVSVLCLSREAVSETDLQDALRCAARTLDPPLSVDGPDAREPHSIDVPSPEDRRSSAGADVHFSPQVLHNLPVIVGRVADSGVITELAGAGMDYLGLSRDRLVGAPFAEVFPSGREALQQAMDGANARFELCIVRRDHGTRCIRVDLFPESHTGGSIGLLAQEIPPRDATQDEIVRAVDSERQRIGADLHDEIGQLLTGITCLSSALVDRLRGRDDLAAEDASAVAQTAREALAQLRSLAHGLAPVQLHRFGLPAALREFAELIHRMHRVEVRLELPRGRCEFEPETATHLFRVVQEATANAIRHGGATIVDVALRQVADGHTLLIRDNGRGFPAHHAPGTGSGLRLMEHRAALLGGLLHIASHPSGGTRLELSFTSTSSRPHETAC